VVISRRCSGRRKFGFATAPLVALGCIMMRVVPFETPARWAWPRRTRSCGRIFNTAIRPHAVNFMKYIRGGSARTHGAASGFRTINENDSDAWTKLRRERPWSIGRRAGLISPRFFTRPKVADTVGRYCQIPQDPRPGKGAGQHRCCSDCARRRWNGREKKWVVKPAHPQRQPPWSGPSWAVKLTRRWGVERAPGGTRCGFNFKGSAGQSFWRVCSQRGDTHAGKATPNDYLGKGLSGGKIIVLSARKAQPFCAGGKTSSPGKRGVVWGRRAGEVYICGMARRAVRRPEQRKSTAVVEAGG